MATMNDIKTYQRLLDTFGAHWESVNAQLGGEPMVLPGGVNRRTFFLQKTTLTNLYQAVEAGDNAAATASADTTRLKSDLLPRLSQLNATIKGLLPGSRYAAALIKVPAKTAAQGVVVKALQDALDLWARIEADDAVTFAKPLTLADGTTKATLQGGLDALLSAYDDATSGKQAARSARSERNAFLKTLDRQLIQYRKTAQARLPRGHSLLTSLPAASTV
jgi:hypothetical protein